MKHEPIPPKDCCRTLVLGSLNPSLMHAHPPPQIEMTQRGLGVGSNM